jgi:hypothetical protein
MQVFYMTFLSIDHLRFALFLKFHINLFFVAFFSYLMIGVHFYAFEQKYNKKL